MKEPFVSSNAEGKNGTLIRPLLTVIPPIGATSRSCPDRSATTGFLGEAVSNFLRGRDPDGHAEPALRRGNQRTTEGGRRVRSEGTPPTVRPSCRGAAAVARN